jgi:putative alpha-1,2-mannosidase
MLGVLKMSLFARSGLALALLVAVAAAAQAAPKPVEQLYAECHKRIVTPKGKFKEGDPKTDEAVEACVRKKLGPAAKAAPQEQ